MINILSTDTRFLDSPDVGEPDCLCSRCGKPILGGVPFRAWPDDIGQPGSDNYEYRYHNACQGLDPKYDQDQELEDWEIERWEMGYPAPPT